MPGPHGTFPNLNAWHFSRRCFPCSRSAAAVQPRLVVQGFKVGSDAMDAAAKARAFYENARLRMFFHAEILCLTRVAFAAATGFC